MPHPHLRKAIATLDALLSMTRQDIEDIREARHDAVISRTRAKENLLLSFEQQKRLVDHELVGLTRSHSSIPLSELLDTESRSLLAQLKERLEELKEVNRRYARMVLAVSEFYSSLLERLLPHQSEDYSGKKRTTASFLTLEA